MAGPVSPISARLPVPFSNLFLLLDHVNCCLSFTDLAVSPPSEVVDGQSLCQLTGWLALQSKVLIERHCHHLGLSVASS